MNPSNLPYQSNNSHSHSHSYSRDGRPYEESSSRGRNRHHRRQRDEFENVVDGWRGAGRRTSSSSSSSSFSYASLDSSKRPRLYHHHHPHHDQHHPHPTKSIPKSLADWISYFDGRIPLYWTDDEFYKLPSSLLRKEAARQIRSTIERGLPSVVQEARQTLVYLRLSPLHDGGNDNDQSSSSQYYHPALPVDPFMLPRGSNVQKEWLDLFRQYHREGRLRDFPHFVYWLGSGAAGSAADAGGDEEGQKKKTKKTNLCFSFISQPDMKGLMKQRDNRGHDDHSDTRGLELEPSKVAAAQEEVAQYHTWLSSGPPKTNKSQLRSLWTAQWDSTILKNNNRHASTTMTLLSRPDFYQSMLLLLQGCPDHPQGGPNHQHSPPAETRTSPETTITATAAAARMTPPPTRDDLCSSSSTTSASQQPQKRASPNDFGASSASSFSYSSLGRSIPSVTPPPLPHNHADDTTFQQHPPSSTLSSSSSSSSNSGGEEQEGYSPSGLQVVPSKRHATIDDSDGNSSGLSSSSPPPPSPRVVDVVEGEDTTTSQPRSPDDEESVVMKSGSPFSPYRPLSLFSAEDDPGTIKPKGREETLKSKTATIAATTTTTTKKASRKRVTFRPILEEQIKEKKTVLFDPAAMVPRENRRLSSTDTIVTQVPPETALDTEGEIIIPTVSPKPVAEEDVSTLSDQFVDDVTKYRRMHNMSDEVMALNIWL